MTLKFVTQKPKIIKVKRYLGFYPESIYPTDVLPNCLEQELKYADAPANGTILYGNYVNPLEGYYQKKTLACLPKNKNEFPFI